MHELIKPKFNHKKHLLFILRLVFNNQDDQFFIGKSTQLSMPD